MASNLECTLKRHNGADFDNLYPSTSWAQIADKPSTFTPTSHAHGNISNAGAITGDILPGTDNAYDLGSTSYRFAEIWSTVFKEGGTSLVDKYSPKRATMTSVGASRNLATSDVNSVLYVTGAYTLTIPSGTFSAGDQITIIRTGASTVTITPGSGVTINGSTSSLTITTAYRAITLIFQASGTVYAIGV